MSVAKESLNRHGNVGCERVSQMYERRLPLSINSEMILQYTRRRKMSAERMEERGRTSEDLQYSTVWRRCSREAEVLQRHLGQERLVK